MVNIMEIESKIERDFDLQDSRGPSPEFLSPLRLARLAHAESFVDDPAFQSCVESVWYGR